MGVFSKSLIALSMAFGMAAGSSVANAQMMPPRAAPDQAQMITSEEEHKAHAAVMATPHKYKHPTLASNSDEEVGLALTLLFDVSGSIDQADYQAQVRSMAEAIASDDFRDGIFLEGGPKSIAISVIDYGTSVSMRIPWVDIREGEEEKLQQLAAEILNLPRRESGSTNQADALDFAAIALENCPWDTDRRVVDIITDGEHNYRGSAETVVRNARVHLAEEIGATVNALVIIDTFGGETLEEYAEEHLRTQEARETEDGRIVDEGFVIVVATNRSPDNPGALVRYYQEMIRAFKTKLRLEISHLDEDNISLPFADPGRPGLRIPQSRLA